MMLCLRLPNIHLRLIRILAKSKACSLRTREKILRRARCLPIIRAIRVRYMPISIWYKFQKTLKLLRKTFIRNNLTGTFPKIIVSY